MKREIKFRGKRLDTGEWEFGNLIIAENGAPYIFPPEICEVDGHHLRQGDDKPHWVDHATVGQFIGLKDKHGLKVYEGDIMALGDRKNRIGVIVRSELSPEFVLRVGDTEYTLYYGAPSQRYEVLGNIYDDPELLNK